MPKALASQKTRSARLPSEWDIDLWVIDAIWLIICFIKIENEGGLFRELRQLQKCFY